jgi:hypothetical protein
MKYIKNKIVALASLCGLLLNAGCEDNNYLHQKYLDQGETIYIGIVDSIGAEPGYNRVRFGWKSANDPRITKTVFYYNLGDNSFEKTVQKGTQTQPQTTIFDLTEGVYAFEVINYDAHGNRSLAQDVTVEIYGESYKESLRTMNINSMSVSTDNNTLTINWAGAESATTLYSTVTYVRASGVTLAPVKVPVSQTSTTITVGNISAGDYISVVTTYQPEGGIDIVDSNPRTFNVK